MGEIIRGVGRRVAECLSRAYLRRMIRLFTKTGCPWCVDAVEYLTAKGVDFTELDVWKDPEALDEMQTLSGQTKAPTMELEDGSVLADFDVGEMEEFFREKGISL